MGGELPFSPKRLLPTGLGLHVAEFATAELESGRRIDFTWCDLASGRWLGRDFRLTVATGFD